MGKEIETNGSVLIWGGISKNFNIEEFGKKASEDNRINIKFHDVLSVENMINDLIKWDDINYKELIRNHQDWSTELFSTLSPVLK